EMKSVFRETADADNQKKRRAVFRNLLRQRKRQSHRRLHNSQPPRHAKLSMAEPFARSKFEFQGLEPVKRNTSAGKLRSVESQGTCAAGAGRRGAPTLPPQHTRTHPPPRYLAH